MALEARGLRVAIVSSGAIAAGMGDLGLAKRPDALPQLQACAAVGQARLMMMFDEALKRHGRHAAQILLVRGDVEDRSRYLNIRNSIAALQSYGAVPVINENDTVSVDEIRFGENDILAAMVTNLLRADLLVLLTTVDGVFRDKARKDKFDLVEDMAEVMAAADGTRSSLGSGGMTTKLQAAAKVTAAGEMAAIANGRRPNVLTDLLAGEPVGTLFLPKARKMKARDRWIGLTSRPRGKLIIDAGAARPSVPARASSPPASRPSRATSRPATSSPWSIPPAPPWPRASRTTPPTMSIRSRASGPASLPPSSARGPTMRLSTPITWC